MGLAKLYRAPVLRPLALAALILALGAAPAAAGTQELSIVVVPGLELEDLGELQAQGAAVGLLVPANGPTTSGAQARAALTRGEVRNSFLDGGVPDGPPLVSFETAGAPPASGSVIVVGLPEGGGQPNDRRYPVAVLAPGFDGMLVSDSTRLPGIVSIAEIAPTALGQDGGLTSEPEANAAARVLELDRLIDQKKDARLASGLLVAGLVLLLALVFPRAALLAYLTALTANLALGATETVTVWIVLLAIFLAVAAAVPLALVVKTDGAIGLALAAVLALYLAAFLVDGAWIAYSPWGPAQAGRFYGITNLLETLLLVPALAGATFLARRFGAVGFGVVAALALVLVGGGRFGADGGGIVVFAVGFAMLAVLLVGLRGRALILALVGTALVAGGLLALDAATGGSSHVTETLSEGPGELASRLGDRLVISWERATLGPEPALLTFVCLGVLLALVVETLRSNEPLRERALPLAVAAAVAASLVVNDAPNDIAVGGLVAFVVCRAAMLRARCAAASCSRSPLALFWPVAADRRPLRPPPRP
jgi:hypothetical protein